MGLNEFENFANKKKPRKTELKIKNCFLIIFLLVQLQQLLQQRQ